MDIDIKLSELHINQQKVIDEQKRFNVLCCGRRWGKSELATDILCDNALDGKTLGYFTPTYKLLDGTYNECLSILDPIIERKNDHQFIQIKGGGRVDFWSLENELAGRSRKYHIAILDECAFTKNLWKIWTEAIRATLTDYKGKAWFLSTPKGKNDFYKLFMRGKSGEENWASWQMSTYTNPFIDPLEVDDAKHDLPALAFSQEYLAEFNDNVANPFGTQFIAQCTYPISTEPPVCFGVDLAKSYDWTVIIGLDKNCQVCFFERFQKDWKTTVQTIINLPAANIAIDSTGVGDPIAEEVARVRTIDSVKYTAPVKQQLMEGLAVAIQKREITFPEGPITDELGNFEFIYTRTGVKYSAPEGLHDDCVNALALARKIWKATGQGVYAIY
jgi:phage FluMu gp28-like protein